MALSRYRSWVEPTWQNRVGSSRLSSAHIVYADVPGAVVSCHGSSLVPVIRTPLLLTLIQPLGGSRRQDHTL